MYNASHFLHFEKNFKDENNKQINNKNMVLTDWVSDIILLTVVKMILYKTGNSEFKVMDGQL